MYLMNADLYQCDFCGVIAHWDDHASGYRGDIWECEFCGHHFCTDCFVRLKGREVFDKMLRESDVVVCPNCYDSNAFGVKEECENG